MGDIVKVPSNFYRMSASALERIMFCHAATLKNGIPTKWSRNMSDLAKYATDRIASRSLGGECPIWTDKAEGFSDDEIFRFYKFARSAIKKWYYRLFFGMKRLKFVDYLNFLLIEKDAADIQSILYHWAKVFVQNTPTLYQESDIAYVIASATCNVYLNRDFGRVAKKSLLNSNVPSTDGGVPMGRVFSDFVNYADSWCIPKVRIYVSYSNKAVEFVLINEKAIPVDFIPANSMIFESAFPNVDGIYPLGGTSGTYFLSKKQVCDGVYTAGFIYKSYMDYNPAPVGAVDLPILMKAVEEQKEDAVKNSNKVPEAFYRMSTQALSNTMLCHAAKLKRGIPWEWRTHMHPISVYLSQLAAGDFGKPQNFTDDELCRISKFSKIAVDSWYREVSSGVHYLTFIEYIHWILMSELSCTETLPIIRMWATKFVDSRPTILNPISAIDSLSRFVFDIYVVMQIGADAKRKKLKATIASQDGQVSYSVVLDDFAKYIEQHCIPKIATRVAYDKYGVKFLFINTEDLPHGISLNQAMSFYTEIRPATKKDIESSGSCEILETPIGDRIYMVRFVKIGGVPKGKVDGAVKADTKKPFEMERVEKREGDDSCKYCPYANETGELALANLEKMSADLGIVKTRTERVSAIGASVSGLSERQEAYGKELFEALKIVGTRMSSIEMRIADSSNDIRGAFDTLSNMKSDLYRLSQGQGELSEFVTRVDTRLSAIEGILRPSSKSESNYAFDSLALASIGMIMKLVCDPNYDVLNPDRSNRFFKEIMAILDIRNKVVGQTSEVKK